MSNQFTILASGSPWLLAAQVSVRAGKPATSQLVLEPYPNIEGESTTESQQWTFEQATAAQLTAGNVNFLRAPNGGLFYFIKNAAYNTMIGTEGPTTPGASLGLFEQVPANPAGLLWFTVPHGNTGEPYIAPDAGPPITDFWIKSGAGNLAIAVNGNLRAGAPLYVRSQGAGNNNQLWQIPQIFTSPFDPKIAIDGYGIQNNVLYVILVGAGYPPGAKIGVVMTINFANGSTSGDFPQNVYTADLGGRLQVTIEQEADLQDSAGIAGATFRFTMGASGVFGIGGYPSATLTTHMAANGTFYNSSGGTVSAG